MIKTLDHIIIAVSNLDKAEESYTKIFGSPSVWKGEHKEYGTINCLFNFQNTYFELLAAKGEGLGASLVEHSLKEKGEGLIGIVFGTNDINKSRKKLIDKGFLVGDISSGEGTNFKDRSIRKWKNLFLPPELTRGLFSFLIQHTHGSLQTQNVYSSSTVNKLDHLVINTSDADGFIKIYKDVFDIRLALDRYVKEWKSRILFFRFNKTTIEVIEKKNDETSDDSLWGLCWEVKDIGKTHKRLLKEGVKVSEIKNGIKANTLVATIESHTHNIPTLLIEHLDKSND
jgi:catechol 2,3-dioxygenase-like lactoylglutathione lyase family enzyme